MQDSKFADIGFSDFPIFIFKVNQVFMFSWKKKTTLEKVVIDEEELDGIEIDGISNLENLPRTVFIIRKWSLMEKSLIENY